MGARRPHTLSAWQSVSSQSPAPSLSLSILSEHSDASSPTAGLIEQPYRKAAAPNASIAYRV
jgi:hypothetical protein